MNNNEDLNELSIEEINEMFKDIIEIQDSSMFVAVKCKQGSGDNCSSNYR